MVVSNIFHFHPYLGKIPSLTNICSEGSKPTSTYYNCIFSNYNDLTRRHPQKLAWYIMEMSSLKEVQVGKISQCSPRLHPVIFFAVKAQKLLIRRDCDFHRILHKLLMEEILDQLIGSLSDYAQGFIHPRWCRISSINSRIGLQKFESLCVLVSVLPEN